MASWTTRGGALTGGLALLFAAGCTDEFSAGTPDAGTPGGGLSKDGLVYWFSADTGVTESSGRVTRWSDRSGNRADAVQITEEDRPKLAHLGGGNHPALEFDGEGDFLGLPPLTTSFADGVSVFAVARNTAGGPCMAMLEVSNGSEIDDVSFDWNQSALHYEVTEGTVDGRSGAFAQGESRLLEAIQGPSGDVNLWMNGTANGVGSFALPEDKTRNQNFLGRSLYVNCPTWHGEIAELILYARALDTNERRELETYLTEKWECCGT